MKYNITEYSEIDNISNNIKIKVFANI